MGLINPNSRARFIRDAMEKNLSPGLIVRDDAGQYFGGISPLVGKQE